MSRLLIAEQLTRTRILNMVEILELIGYTIRPPIRPVESTVAFIFFYTLQHISTNRKRKEIHPYRNNQLTNYKENCQFHEGNT